MIDWNCYADKIICNENNIWKRQHKNVLLDKGKKFNWNLTWISVQFSKE